jgi:hypothetical protein
MASTKDVLLHWALGLALIGIAIFVGMSLLLMDTEAATNQVSISNAAPTFVADPEIANTEEGTETYSSGTISNIISGSSRDIYVKGQVEDLNGAEDIDYVKVNFYRSDTDCSSATDRDMNTCYYRDATTDPLRCSYSSVEGNENRVAYTCRFTLYSWIDATDGDAGTDSDKHWVVSVYVEDDDGLNATSPSRTVEIASTTGLDIPTSISFGTMSINSQTTTPVAQEITQQGNVAQDVTVRSSAAYFNCSNSTGGIPRENLHWSTNEVGWGSDGDTAISSTIVDTDLAVGKRVHEFIAPTKELYWNIKIPSGVEGTCSSSVDVTAKNANL